VWFIISVELFDAQASWAQKLKCPPAESGMAVQHGEIFPLPGAVFSLENLAATMHAREKTVPYCLV
jgi:hypothetical protein